MRRRQYSSSDKLKYPVKVLHLIQGLDVGGLEYVVINLLKGLNRDKYQPSVCCFDTLGSIADALNGYADVYLLKRKPGVNYSYPFKLAVLLKREKIQILHTHNSTAYFYGAIAGIIAHVPVVIYTEHARDIFPNIKVRIVERMLSMFVDRIIVVAEVLKENLVKHEWFNPSKITTIYNGIDENKFTKVREADDVKSILGFSKNNHVIGIIGRLDPIKNHKCLIKAVHLVNKRFPEAKLLIIGDGSYRHELELFVKEQGAGEHVFFLGTREDVPQLLNAIDIFVLCSISEGMPVTLLEAMATERPIVATKVGGIHEIIEHGREGILVESNNHELLAEAIADLLAHKDKAMRLGSSARKRLKERFTLAAMIEKYEEVYDDSIKRE